ncbi:MAG: hypothetical protein ACU0BK_15005, partial [Shimia sp.]|uniref:hypothetical protein n=1 Tax=Shimia sp. TaxID=1954381 RepID=UPI004058BFA8
AKKSKSDAKAFRSLWSRTAIIKTVFSESSGVFCGTNFLSRLGAPGGWDAAHFGSMFKVSIHRVRRRTQMVHTKTDFFVSGPVLRPILRQKHGSIGLVRLDYCFGRGRRARVTGTSLSGVANRLVERALARYPFHSEQER